MPRSTGDKVGHYEIVAPLGAGGMGEVYRARDSELGREVALKVLPQEFAWNPDRLARFEREARILATLNHPNIATIYVVAESDGVRALVMELVAGTILHGPLPAMTALRYAGQIAQALEAAHEKGIIHRDLKPGNIMITPDGAVKVLDFGLAAFSLPAETGPQNSDDSPTLLTIATQTAVIMGTAAYMSPEQAAGKTVDKRSDIWSFGVVLWEMLTGERVFKGETISHTLADVLRAPIDFSRLPKETPRAARDLLRRCLTRDVTRRLRDIGEARIALEDALSGVDSQQAEVAARSTIVPWIVAAVCVAALAVLAFVHFRQADPKTPVLRATLLPPEGTGFNFDVDAGLPALSPDGARIVFGSRARQRQLWLRRLDSSDAQPLPGTENAEFPFWSPDNRWVAFGQGNALKKIDIQGGLPVQIADLSGPFFGGSWSPLGIIVFGANSNGPRHGLFRIPAAGGTAAPATTLEADKSEAGKRTRNDAFPWFLPDGRHFLYDSQRDGGELVRVGSLDEPGKPGKVVAQASSSAVYASGHLLYLRGTTLMAQSFDTGHLQTSGEAVPLTEGVPSYFLRNRGVFSVAGGLLVYQAGVADVLSRIVWKDRQGNALGDLGEAAGKMDTIEFSPDGKRLAARIADKNSDLNLWVYDTARGVPTRFTFGQAPDSAPVWSPDGGTIYFSSDREGQNDLFRKAANGGSMEEILLSDPTAKQVESVSPDGKLLLFRRSAGKNGSDLWVLSLGPAGPGRKTEERVFLATPFNERAGQFSPDGHWVAYQSDESGRYEIYVAPFPGPGGARQISSGGGFLPRWRRDGKELFFASAKREAMAAGVTIGKGTLEVGTVRKLFDGVIAGGNYEVSADGQKFAVLQGSLAASSPLMLLQDWPAMLRK